MGSRATVASGIRRRAVSATPSPSVSTAHFVPFAGYRPCDRVLKVWEWLSQSGGYGRVRRTLGLPMVAGLAFVATAIATLFAQATAVRWSRSRAPHQGAWTIALALFALASAALATGPSTGWDPGPSRAFYLLGAGRNGPGVPPGTIDLL